MNGPVTRRQLLIENLRNALFWFSVTVPVFGAVAFALLILTGWSGIILVPFVAGPVYLMITAGLSQKTLPDAGWVWFLILCFAGAMSAFLGMLLYGPLESAFGFENTYWLWGAAMAAGAWAGPTLLNIAYLLSFSDEECAILTRGHVS